MRNIGGIYMDPTRIPIGSKIKFQEEKQRYIVKATNIAFTICIKPFNLKKTVFYTIIDWQQNIRGAENLIFGFGAETDKQCMQMLKRLTEGDSEVSGRNNIPLKIEKLEMPNENT